MTRILLLLAAIFAGVAVYELVVAWAQRVTGEHDPFGAPWFDDGRRC